MAYMSTQRCIEFFRNRFLSGGGEIRNTNKARRSQKTTFPATESRDRQSPSSPEHTTLQKVSSRFIGGVLKGRSPGGGVLMMMLLRWNNIGCRLGV